MDFPSAVKNDALRPVATIVAPGAIATTPYVIVVGHYVPVVSRFWTEHETAFGLIVALSILIAGFVLEDIGALIEVAWDERLSGRVPDHAIVWRVYLMLRVKDEIVGQRYLRDIVTRLKFELSMAPAIIICVFGLNWTNALYGTWSRCAMVLMSLALVLVSLFLLWESFQSAELLSRTRRSLIDAVRSDAAGELFLGKTSTANSDER